MKKYLSLLFCLGLAGLVLVSCKPEDEEPPPPEVQNFAPGVGQGKISIHHDDYNTDAPVLEPSTYEMAARFLTSDLSASTGGQLVGVQYYMYLKPHQAELRVYKGGNNAPGNIVYTADLIQEMSANAWNYHAMSDSVLIDEQMWIGIWFEVLGEEKYIGCDPGPANPNGDWMFDESDGDWIRFINRTEANINWNIRGVAVPQ